jgi:outer membrane protein OmpA-like peptidoglycan-associated protein
LLQGPLGDVVVRAVIDADPPARDRLPLVHRVLTELRFRLDGGDRTLAENAERTLAEVDGSQAVPRRLDTQADTRSFLGDLRRRLEDALLAGRLVIDVRETPALSDRPDRPLPDLPPLPPPPPEPGTHHFEVRIVDEIGSAISGLEVEFDADEASSRSTNAAGLAELDGVQTSSASVSLLDPDALDKLLDARWTKLRPGAPPKESNTQEVVFLGNELGPFAVKAEVSNTVVIKPPLGKLFVELWDKTGRARHVERDYQIDGPQSFSGTTDQDGRLLHEEVFPGDYQLSLTIEVFEEGDPDHSTDEVESALVTLAASAGEPQLRMLGAVPRSILARLHMFFNTDKTFLLPTALPAVKKLRELYLDNVPCELLVVGHCDTAGSADHNDKLSLARAQATIAFLNDDVEGWYAFYDDSDAKQRWGKVEDHLMIIAMPGFTDKPKGEDPVRWFQRTRGLDVDGKAGSDTRHALITEYMSLDGTSLADFAGELDATAHGCGENFPLETQGKDDDDDADEDEDSDADAESDSSADSDSNAAPADGQHNPGDRRVELFFFDREFGITPPPPGDNSAPGSAEYPLWLARVSETVELSPGDLDGPSVIFLEITDAHFRTDSAVVLPEGEAPDAKGEHQALTSVGFIARALRFNEEEPDRSVLVAGHTDTQGSEAHNDKLSLLRAKVALAMLEGDRDNFSQLADQQHQPADINQILSWVARAFDDLPFDCDPGKITDSVSADDVKSFQRDFNSNKSGLGSKAADLTVDGVVGELTWGAFFDCYEFALGEELGEDPDGVQALRDKLKFADDDRKALGFGEHFPIEELGVDNFKSQANRRVEILFFEPGEEPDLAHAEDDPETSELYLPGFYEREPLDASGSAKAKDRALGMRVPTRFSAIKSFPKPSAVPALQAALKLLTDRPELTLVIVGHTDPVGSDADNFTLSLARAEAVRAWLTGDQAFFSANFARTTDDAWGFEEIQWMLHAVEVAGAPCYVGQADGFPGRLTTDALGRFQLGTSDLAVSYFADEPTVNALIEQYLQLLGDSAESSRIQVVGGGSWSPPHAFFEAAEPDPDPLLRDLRRVELFFFSTPPKPPVESFPKQRAEPVVYNRWCDQTGQEISVPSVPFRIQAYDPSSSILANSTIQLEQVVDDASSAPAGSVTTDALGCAVVDAPPGTLLASADFGGTTLLTAFELDPDASCGAALAFGVSGGLDNQSPGLEPPQ